MWRLLLPLLLVLYGCSDAPAETPRRKVGESKAPSQQTYRFEHGELLVIDVPSYSSPKYNEMQRCFVWRDGEYKSASLQCPGDASEATPVGGATQDSPHP